MRRPIYPTLDRFDLRILERYQSNTLTPAHVIGAEIGLSAAAVQRRLKRLREAAVIEGELAQVAPAAVGLPVTCIVSVDLDREGVAELDAFRDRMLESSAVQQCYYVTGATDFIIVVVVPAMTAYDDFARRELLCDRNVKSFTTHVVMDRVKAGVALPLQHALAATEQ